MQDKLAGDPAFEKGSFTSLKIGELWLSKEILKCNSDPKWEWLPLETAGPEGQWEWTNSQRSLVKVDWLVPIKVLLDLNK